LIKNGKKRNKPHHYRFTDPIQVAIDRQLRSLWPDKETFLAFSNSRPSSGQMEDLLINSLDLKYHHIVAHRDYQIYHLHCQGFTQTEIGNMYDLSQRRIGQIIQVIQAHKNGHF